MSFYLPAALLLGLLALPIIVLYMLRLRRSKVAISSTLLWHKLIQDREANAPWQRLHRNWLLILQLLILAALVLALARPFLPIDRLVSGNIIVLLDASASMQATDITPNRFSAAQDRVDDLIGELSGGDKMTLVAVGGTPFVAASATSDRSALRSALEGIPVEMGEVDWDSALALAAGAAQGLSDARVVIVSDGGLPDSSPPMSAETLFHSVGSREDNLAISALAAREGAEGISLLSTVTNHGVSAHEALLTLEIDGQLYDSRLITVPGESVSSLSWSLPANTAEVFAWLSGQSEDYLQLDDQAWTAVSGGSNRRVLLVTPGNVFVEQLLSTLPGLVSFKIGPDDPWPPSERFDLVVVDSSPIPTDIHEANLLLINPLLSNEDLLPELVLGSAFTDTAVINLADDERLRFVEWDNVHVREARIAGGPGLRTLIGAQGGPLLLAGQLNRRRVALLPFDLHDSDLPLQIAFPVLMANLIDWLVPGQIVLDQSTLLPGDPVSINAPAGYDAIVVKSPSGDSWQYPLRTESVLFDQTGETGLYHVFLVDGERQVEGGSFAVNLFSSAESDLLPATSLLIVARDEESVTANEIGRRELWLVLAATALVLLLIEWLVYHRSQLRRAQPG